MFSQELLNVLKQVLLSWQVIAMTVVILIYWAIVNSVTRKRRPDLKAHSTKRQKIKRPPTSPQLDKNIDTSDIGIGE
jgi:hypothetical protein